MLSRNPTSLMWSSFGVIRIIGPSFPAMSLCHGIEKQGLTVFFMQLLDLKDIATGLDDIVIEFVPPC
jgi:hypothetical protein